LSLCVANLASANEDAGRTARALPAFERAVELGENLIRANPEAVAFQADLALTLLNHGDALRSVGRPSDSIAAYRRAQGILRALLEADPTASSHRALLAYIEGTGLCPGLLDTGRPAEALAAGEAGRKALQAILRDNPADLLVRKRLAGTEKYLGRALAAVGRLDEAETSIRSSLATLSDVSKPDRDVLYERGCALSLLAGRLPKTSDARPRPEADLAMDALRAAVAAGFQNLALARTQTDLDSLRARPDFQLLMRDLAFPRDPFSPVVRDAP
jgi:eukaryotic-like serine/threonine-protein kinase